MKRSRETAECSWYGCTDPAVGNGYCTAHHTEYSRDWRRRTKPIWSVTREEAEAVVGRPLTDREIKRITARIDLSGAPGLIDNIISNAIEEEA